MKPITQRGLENSMSLLFNSGEFDRLRQFMRAEASSEKPETEEIVKFITDSVRAHLLVTAKQTRTIAEASRTV